MVVSKRKVATSKTTSNYNWLTGQRVATTRTYVHDERPTRPSRTSRTLARTGISPWNPKRLGVVVWALVFLGAFGGSTASGMAFLAVSALAAAAYAGRRYWQDRLSEPEPVEPPRIEPGPVWCDHCADWTVHETDRHQAASA